MQSYEFLQKKQAEEPWVQLHYCGLRVSRARRGLSARPCPSPCSPRTAASAPCQNSALVHVEQPVVQVVS